MTAFGNRAAVSNATAPKTQGTGTAPAPRPTKASNAAQAGRYAGMRGAQARYPLLEELEADLEVLKTYESKNPKTGSWYHADFKILFSNEPPDSKYATGKCCSYLKSVSEKAIETTGPMVVSFTVAAAGYENDDDFFADLDGRDEEHPKANDLLDAASGANSPVKANPLEGCRVHVVSYHTGTSENGKQEYYGQTWTPYQEPDEGEDTGS